MDVNIHGESFAEIDARYAALKASIRAHLDAAYREASDEEIANLAALVESRNLLVRKMATVHPLGRVWNEISKEITDIDALLAPWGLV